MAVSVVIAPVMIELLFSFDFTGPKLFNSLSEKSSGVCRCLEKGMSGEKSSLRGMSFTVFIGLIVGGWGLKEVTDSYRAK